MQLFYDNCQYKNFLFVFDFIKNILKKTAAFSFKNKFLTMLGYISYLIIKMFEWRINEKNKPCG